MVASEVLAMLLLAFNPAVVRESAFHYMIDKQMGNRAMYHTAVPMAESSDLAGGVDEWISSLDESKRAALAQLVKSVRKSVNKRTTKESVPRERILTDAGSAVEALKADIHKVLYKEPHWNIYAEDLKLIDYTGATVEGLGMVKQWLRLVRSLPKTFAAKGDIKIGVAFIDDVRDGPDVFLVARWHVQLRTIGNRRERKKFLVETVFHFNDRSKVDYVRIDQWIGSTIQKFEEWPDVQMQMTGELADGTSNTTLRDFEEWSQNFEDVLMAKSTSQRHILYAH